jgi:transcriptional regulator with XRE-family HTH domain
MGDSQERIGRMVTVLRAERRMQRKALAEQTGLSYAFLCDIEAGKRGMSHTTLRTIADTFGIWPSELLRRAESLPVLVTS